MCAAIEFSTRVVRLGRRIAFRHAAGEAELPWMGFAREEVLGWWRLRGAELVDLPADRFAQRSEFDRQIRWTDLTVGQVIRALLDLTPEEPVIRVLTRPSTPEEHKRLQVTRMPVTDAAILHPAACVPVKSDTGLLL